MRATDLVHCRTRQRCYEVDYASGSIAVANVCRRRVLARLYANLVSSWYTTVEREVHEHFGGLASGRFDG